MNSNKFYGSFILIERDINKNNLKKYIKRLFCMSLSEIGICSPTTQPEFVQVDYNQSITDTFDFSVCV